VLKLAKSGEDGEKAFLLLESGARFHTTAVRRDAVMQWMHSPRPICDVSWITK
jgi:hypothetical protein